MKSTSVIKFKKGILHIGLPILIVGGSAILVFVILRVLGVIGAGPTEPIGEIHANPEVVSGFGTSDSSVIFTASNVEASASAQIDHIRYYLINPDLAPGNTWGDPDWCGNSSPCNQSTPGLKTFDIKHSSNPGNNYEVVWDKNTISSESTQKDRSLTIANLNPGIQRVGLRVEDVNGVVTGNASEVNIQLVNTPASGQIEVSTNQIYDFGTVDASITLNGVNVQGANGTQIDNVRYFAFNPPLTLGNTWGDPDWCSGVTPCTQNTVAPFITYDLGESSNPANNYEIVWDKDSQTSSSTPFERGLTAANILSSEQNNGLRIGIGMRVEDVLGNVTGNVGTAWINLSQNPESTPEPDLSHGLDFSVSNINITLDQGESVFAFDVTSTEAATFSLFNPTNALGMTFVPPNVSGGLSIIPGETKSFEIKNNGQNPGVYTGEVQVGFTGESASYFPGIPVTITVPEFSPSPGSGLSFSVTQLEKSIPQGDTVTGFQINNSLEASATFSLFTPTPSLGVRFVPSSGTIGANQSVQINIEASQGETLGTKVGEVTMEHNGQNYVPGIPVIVTVVESLPVPIPAGGYSITLNPPEKICDGTDERVRLTWTENIGTDYFDIYRSDRGYYTNNAAIGDTWQGSVPEGTFTFKVRNHQWELTGGSPVESNELSIGIGPCVGFAGTVISTQLFSQGLIDGEIWEGDVIYGRNTRINEPNVMEGYHFWARPVVNLMKKSELFTRLVQFIATPVLTQIAYEAGTVDGGSLIGNVILEGGKSISGLVGNFVDESAYTSASN